MILYQREYTAEYFDAQDARMREHDRKAFLAQCEAAVKDDLIEIAIALYDVKCMYEQLDQLRVWRAEVDKGAIDNLAKRQAKLQGLLLKSTFQKKKAGIASAKKRAQKASVANKDIARWARGRIKDTGTIKGVVRGVMSMYEISESKARSALQEEGVLPRRKQRRKKVIEHVEK